MSIQDSEIDDILASAVRVIRKQIDVLYKTRGNDTLGVNDARNLGEYVRALTLIQKRVRDSSAKADAAAKSMTETELESVVLEEAKRIQAKHGNGSTGRT